MRGAAGVWGEWVTPQGHPISVPPKRELCSRQQVRFGCCHQPVCDIHGQDIEDSYIGEGLQIGGLGISSLLFADDLVLMASSACDLQCEAAGMRISTAKSEAMTQETDGLLTPGRK